MVKVTDAPIAQYFGELDDPRIDRSKRHTLLDIITIALCGIICGADSWVDIELFGKCKEDWFRTFLELPNGIPLMIPSATSLPAWTQSSFNVSAQ